MSSYPPCSSPGDPPRALRPLLAILTCALCLGPLCQASDEIDAQCELPPDQVIPGCGMPHTLSRQVDRPRMKIYVPEASEGSNIYNRLSCLAARAKEKWSQACPLIEGEARIPEIEIVRGDGHGVFLRRPRPGLLGDDSP